jgi:hypothetical protein
MSPIIVQTSSAVASQNEVLDFIIDRWRLASGFLISFLEVCHENESPC